MSNGCICCTLRDDLLQEVSRLAQEGRFDYLLIESTGISEPIPVAQTFTFEDEHGVSLSQISRLDTMVTVVDANSFLNDYNEAESLQSRGESLGEEDNRTVTDLLIDQIEFADVIVLNKLDLVNEEQASEVEAILSALNPGAEIIPTTQSKVPLQRVLDTGLFDYDKAESSAGWIRELQGEHTPETEEYGISSFTYRQSRPFDARKFADAIAVRKNLQGVLRAKGFFWVVADHRVAYQFAQAGGILNINPVGLWWARSMRTRSTSPRNRDRIGNRIGTSTTVIASRCSCSSARTWTRRPFEVCWMTAFWPRHSPRRTSRTGKDVRTHSPHYRIRSERQLNPRIEPTST